MQHIGLIIVLQFSCLKGTLKKCRQDRFAETMNARGNFFDDIATDYQK